MLLVLKSRTVTKESYRVSSVGSRSPKAYNLAGASPTPQTSAGPVVHSLK